MLGSVDYQLRIVQKNTIFYTTQNKGVITQLLTKVKNKHSSGERVGGRCQVGASLFGKCQF